MMAERSQMKLFPLKLTRQNTRVRKFSQYQGVASIKREPRIGAG